METTLPINTVTTYHVQEDIIEVKLWTLYLLLSKTTLYDEIASASLDRGPVEKHPHNLGRVTFRFSVHAWKTSIKKLLYANRIPVVVTDTPLMKLLA